MKQSPFIMMLILFALAITISGCMEQPQSSSDTMPSSSPSAIADPSLQVNEIVTSANPGVQQEEQAESTLDIDDGFQGVRQIDVSGKILWEWASESTTIIQPVWTEKDDLQEESLLAYSSSTRQVEVLLADGSHYSLVEPTWSNETGYGNDYGFDVLYADRLLNERLFAVKDNRNLYLTNTKTGQATKLYSAEKPVYGVAASPDNSKVALLVASEKEITTYADLIVLSDKGKVLYSMEKAAYVSHSDGFLFVYPMTWIDSHTIAVPFYGHGEHSPWSKAYIDITADQSEIQEQELLPNNAQELLVQHAGEVEWVEMLRALPQAVAVTSEYYAVQIDDGASWLLNMEQEKATKLASSIPLKWTQDGNLLLWKPNVKQSHYYIGLDHMQK